GYLEFLNLVERILAREEVEIDVEDDSAVRRHDVVHSTHEIARCATIAVAHVFRTRAPADDVVRGESKRAPRAILRAHDDKLIALHRRTAVNPHDVPEDALINRRNDELEAGELLVDQTPDCFEVAPNRRQGTAEPWRCDIGVLVDVKERAAGRRE